MDLSSEWTNADEVEAFIAEHKDRWSVGDKFVLPDIEQAYTVLAVRPFRNRGKFRLFVDLEAECAVEGCGDYLVTTKEVHQWRASRYLMRCCEAHNRQFTTTMPGAWKTKAEREALRAERARGFEDVPRAAEKAATRLGRRGKWERAVLAVYDAGSQSSACSLLREVTGTLPGHLCGDRDVVSQNVARAIRSLRAKGLIRVGVAPATERYDDLL